jgi:hypothetical protein
MIRQVVYTSTLTVPSQKRAQFLSDIRAVSQKKNTPRGITGALLIAGDLVVQFIEGSDASLSALLASLRADPRHTGLEIIHDSIVSVPDMPEWAMAIRDMTGAEDSAQQIHEIVHTYRRSFLFQIHDLLLIVRTQLEFE